MVKHQRNTNLLFAVVTGALHTTQKSQAFSLFVFHFKIISEFIHLVYHLLSLTKCRKHRDFFL